MKALAPWYLYDDVLIERDSEILYDNYRVECGEVSDGDTTLFRFLILDIEDETPYRSSINSSWIPTDKDKDWLLGVLASQYTEALWISKASYKRKLHKSVSSLFESIGFDLRNI